ncbi:peptide/nickel transport system substrate-binding protein [Actinoplanes lutulentus]|uniref:Peptide/nickel transport system substrate-binding protein n=1 Tax=Actinoplanes lutulentus TaxID=1287878 RepID=A0A327ZB96_9ACTN|nr:ABC transporter substrate-binding protein [Actinoplanes lutulentus]MBB2947225.1 peptide/nickel transport system substrate-binding protein [Actinoplanes lutulentus]RAK36500.1 peptide/nickel transport system substrate-binding protein [Actinoplanes lutulentus]
MKLRTLVAGAATATLALALAACGSSSSTTTTTGSSRADTLIIGTGATPQTLDPLLSSDVQTDLTSVAVYDTLLTYDSDDKLVPKLATEWKVADDATSITFTLREGAKFHDGTPVTAADVVYTLDRVRKLNLGIATVIADYKSSSATDGSHVTVTLSRANAGFLGALSRVYIVNSALVTANAGTDDGQTWLATHDAGSGAYTLADYRPNQQARFTRYDQYWDGPGKRPASMVYRYSTESATLRDELKQGNIDVAYGLVPTDQAQFTNATGFTSTDVKGPLQLYTFFNTSQGPTADVRVRKALRLAYDYQGHVDNILSGKGVVADGPLPSTMSCRPAIAPSAQNVDEAKKLLAEAGATNLKLTMYYQSVIPEHNKAGTLLQSNLRDIGVTLELKAVTYPEFVKAVSDPKTAPDLGLLWDFPLYPDAASMLYRVYDSKFIGTGSNYGQYSNPEVDALLDKATKATSQDQSCAYAKQVQQIVNDDAVSMNIANSTYNYLHKSTVAGFAYAPTHTLLDTTALHFQ